MRLREGGFRPPCLAKVPGYAATSRSTSGCNSATRISVFAAPLGTRRPCSHCSSVLRDTPKRAANCDCVRPDLSRARAIGERGSSAVHLLPPALISFTPSRTSCQMSRLASSLASARALSFLGIFECFLQLLRMWAGAFSRLVSCMGCASSIACVPNGASFGAGATPRLPVPRRAQRNLRTPPEPHAIKRARLDKCEYT
jgi:hypothetical protein